VGVRAGGLDEGAEHIGPVRPEGRVDVGDCPTSERTDDDAQPCAERPSIPRVFASAADAMDDVGMLALERCRNARKILPRELAVTVDVEDDRRLRGEPGSVGGECGRAVTSIGGLDLHRHTIDAQFRDHGSRRIRRSIVSDDDVEAVRMILQVFVDLAEEPSDAVRLVVCGHDDRDVS
jgi:hypothetical protein